MKLFKKTSFILLLLIPVLVIGFFGKWIGSITKQAQGQSCWQVGTTVGTTGTTSGTTDSTTGTTGTTGTTDCTTGSSSCGTTE